MCLASRASTRSPSRASTLALCSDLARAAGQSPDVYNITEISAGSIIVTTAIIATDPAIAANIATTTQSAVGSNFAPTETLALAATDPVAALEDPSATISSSDVSAQVVTPTPSPSGASATTLSIAAVIAVAIATMLAMANPS